MSRVDPQLNHERLDVYWVSIDFVAWLHALVHELTGPARHARDQALRASQSVPLNIAEGNSKRDSPERRRFFEIARGSMAESAATLDVLVAIQAVESEAVAEGKALAKRVIEMLVKLAPPSRKPMTRTKTITRVARGG